MRITDLYSDVVSEDIKYEYKAELNPENPVKWAKTIVGYANGDGGILFVYLQSRLYHHREYTHKLSLVLS